MKLLDAEEHLRHSDESRAKESEKASETMIKLESLCENLEKMAQEKSSLEWELKIKKRECQLLGARLEKDAYNQVLLEKIDKARRRIKSLKEELQRKDFELQSALKEVQSSQNKLLQAQIELKRQHEKVMQLRIGKEKLAHSYNIRSKQVSKLVQILVSNKEETKVYKVD